MQRWLTDAAPVRNDPAAREQLTLGLGPRFHFKVGENALAPPGSVLHPRPRRCDGEEGL